MMVAAVLLSTGAPATAGPVTIVPNFTASITGDPNAASIEAAINSAITEIEGDITSPNSITVHINYQEMSSGLGESSTFITNVSYDDYYNAFKAVATSANQLTALASLGVAPSSESAGNPVNGSTQVQITTAEARNLGFTANPPAGSPDSTISLNTLITSPPNGLSGNYGLQAVAMHETDEALGIGGDGSTLSGSGSLTGAVGDLDLYRYSASGARSYVNTITTSPLAYLSINGGLTVLAYFNQSLGADFGDWLSNPIPAGFSPQVQDAFGEPGTNPALGANELAAFSAIGYGLTASSSSVPEPSTLLLGGLSLAMGYCVVRRRRTAA